MKVEFSGKELVAVEEALRGAFGRVARATGMSGAEVSALIEKVEQAKAEEIEEQLNDFNYVGSKWHY